MSDVLIRGIEMPNTCKECIIGNPKNKTCYILGSPKRNLEIREDCPLIEVPPHSDLVDRNYLISEYDRQHKGPAGGARRIMEDAPPIIEGSET